MKRKLLLQKGILYNNKIYNYNDSFKSSNNKVFNKSFAILFLKLNKKKVANEDYDFYREALGNV